MAIFEQYPVASWKVGALPAVAFAIVSIRETGGQRLVKQERPHRSGAKVDTTGVAPRVWAITAVFNNTLQEPGLEVNPEPAYPNTLRRLLEAFEVTETGDLVLPTVGKVRARIGDYDRSEVTEARDEGVLNFTFHEDNEEALDRAKLMPPSVRASSIVLAEQTVFSAQANGSWSDNLAGFFESVEALQEQMLAPGRAANEVAATVSANQRRARRIIETDQATARQVATDAFQPRGSGAERLMRRMIGLQAQAVDERNSSRPKAKAFTVDVAFTSIYEIAARLEQDAEELLALNDSLISDPFTIPKGQTVRVFETRPR